VSSLHAIRGGPREMADPDTRENGTRPTWGLRLDSALLHLEGSIALALDPDVRIVPSDANSVCARTPRAAIHRPRPASNPLAVATVGTTSTPARSVQPRPTFRRTTCGCTWMPLTAAGPHRADRPPSRSSSARFAVVNAHKWLFTTMDLSAFFTRRPEILRRTFSLVPEYLRTAPRPRA